MSPNPIALKRWSEARKWVLHEGRRANAEFICAYDATTGQSLCHTGNQLPGRVQIPHQVIAHAATSGAEIGIHHNHPNNSALTAADIQVLARNPGIRAVVAHAHDGCDYVAEVVERGNVAKQVVCLETELLRLLRKDATAVRLHADGVLTKLQGHLLCLALQKSGVIRYRAYLSKETLSLYGMHQHAIDSWVQAVVISCPITRRQ